MGSIEAGNTLRIASLEKCSHGLDAKIHVIDERTIRILESVEKVERGFEKLTEMSQNLALEFVRHEEKWVSYEKDKAALAADLKEVEVIARSNQLTLAKAVALSGGGGAAVYILGLIFEKLF